MTHKIIPFIALIFVLGACSSHAPGDEIDAYEGVVVYANGGLTETHGRNTTADGYNVGLQWQCVEFVKRFYLEKYQHKMPNAWGHARDFFDKRLAEGERNPGRNLKQYPNGSQSPPSVGDILIWDGNWFNKFGHVAIVSAVVGNEIEVVQQNKYPTREKLNFKKREGKYYVDHERILGWLSRK